MSCQTKPSSHSRSHWHELGSAGCTVIPQSNMGPGGCTTQAFHRLSTRCSTWKISCDKQKQRSLLRRQTLVRCFCQQRFDLKHRNPFPRLAITSTFSAHARNVGLQSLLKSLRLCTITRGERFSIRSQQSNPNGFDIPGLMLLQALQDVSIV